MSKVKENNCICKVCHSPFYVNEYRKKNGGGKFCSQKCYGLWASENRVAENSARWNGGKVEKVCEECGKIFLAEKSHIRNGRGKFCSIKCVGASNSKNRTGCNNPSWKGGKATTWCKWCGMEIKLWHAQIRHGEGLFCSKKCKGKWMSQNLIGVNANNYKPDITDMERFELRYTLEYKMWIKSVYERDNYTCQHCNQRGGELNAHHIIPFSKDKSLRTEITNGITLCVKCHRKEHKRLSIEFKNQLRIF